jgi:hypothetical protein
MAGYVIIEMIGLGPNAQIGIAGYQRDGRGAEGFVGGLGAYAKSGGREAAT